ncbi:TetR/AcrR family transcriptional regulator [Micromonospora chokoriensis]
MVARRHSILAAAWAVFLQQGYRKTSMDDIARAAGLSRQGLYLHFKTKDSLFRTAVEHMLGELRDGTLGMLAREDLTLADRLTGAFDIFHGATVGQVELRIFGELLAAARSFAEPKMLAMERELVSAVAELLVEERDRCGLTATDLAEHLFDASAGAKYESSTREIYRSRLRRSVQVVTTI